MMTLVVLLHLGKLFTKIKTYKYSLWFLICVLFERFSFWDVCTVNCYLRERWILNIEIAWECECLQSQTVNLIVVFFCLFSFSALSGVLVSNWNTTSKITFMLCSPKWCRAVLGSKCLQVSPLSTRHHFLKTGCWTDPSWERRWPCPSSGGR